MDPVTRMKLEAGASGALVSSPLWVDLMQNVSLVASTIAAVCGAVYGIYTMFRLYKIWRDKRNTKGWPSNG